jgi:predicted glutamine amidotransferase
MCRIFGISYSDKAEREELDAGEIAAILYPSLIHQGPHAWGWMTYNGQQQDLGIRSFKFPGRSDTEKAFKIQLGNIDPEPTWLVGHLRYATHGSPQDNRNNHPLPHGNVIGVHNGVLRNHDEILAKTGRQDEKTEVDSEAIFAAVNRWGAKKGLAKIHGDMVAVYANRERPHVLHIARTHGRQLTIGYTEKGNMIFASEEQALWMLEPEIKFRKFTTISENRLLVVRNGKIITRLTFREPEKRVWKVPAGSVLFPSTPSKGKGKKGKHPKPNTGSAATYFDRQVNRAVSRGEKLFPTPRTTADRREQGFTFTPKHVVEADGSLPGGDADPKTLYWWGGQLMSADEYREAIELERKWLEEDTYIAPPKKST